jgi:hypothetical protein
MVNLSVLAVFLAAVALSLECEMAALVFLGVAYGVARYLV